MKKLTAKNYTKDTLYPQVARAMAALIDAGGVVAPVEVLLRLKRITKKQYEDWRFGRIAYLERVCIGNLSRMARILRIIELHARKLGLTPSHTAYHKWGRGGKRIVLRFSKFGRPSIEAAYSRHYLTQKARTKKGAAKAVPGKAVPAKPAVAEDAPRERAEPSDVAKTRECRMDLDEIPF